MTKLLNIIVLHVHETRLEKSYKEPRVYETDILTREAPTFSMRKREDGAKPESVSLTSSSSFSESLATEVYCCNTPMTQAPAMDNR